MNAHFKFKHFSTLAMKLLTVVQNYFKLQLLPQHYEPVFS